MYYSYKNCNVLLDNFPIHVNEASISVNASVAPTFYAEKSSEEYYVTENGLNGSLKMSYYMTGRDFLKDYIGDDTRSLKANFGGLYFNSGYITSYSINGEPNSPVKVDVEIIFFEDLNGSFTPTYNFSQNNLAINFSDCFFLSGFNFGALVSDVSNVRSFSYNASMEVTPNYIDDLTDNRMSLYGVTFGPQQCVLDIIYDNLNTQVPISGDDAKATILFRNSGLSIVDALTTSGKLFQKDISISPNSAIISKISIKENSIIPPPSISGFTPLTGDGAPSTLVFIRGTGFRTTLAVYYGTKKVPHGVQDDNNIFTFATKTIKTGFYKVVTRGGSAISSAAYVVSSATIGAF